VPPPQPFSFEPPQPPSGEEMVGIVVVSHSWPLARAAVEMTRQMVPAPVPRIEIAAGLDEQTLGTDAVRVKEAIERANGPDGVLVLLDLGSAVLSGELSLDLLDDAVRSHVVLSPAPLVEGLIAAAITAAGGAPLEEVAEEASSGLAAKRAHLGAAPTTVTVPADTSTSERGTFIVGNPQGLHARPAARLVAQVRGLDAAVQLTNLSNGTGPVPASSISRVATLGAQTGHRVEVIVTGRQASESLHQILELAGRDFDEGEIAAPTAQTRVAGPLTAAPGIAIGPAWRAHTGIAAEPVSQSDDEPADPVRSWRQLQEAIHAVREEIAHARMGVSQANASEAAIFDVHLLLLDDAELLNAAQLSINAGITPARAWSSAYIQVERMFSDLPDPYLRARAADVRAVGEQVLHHLSGASPAQLSREGILIEADLTPVEVANLDLRLVQGVVLAGGSPTSHAAILARSRGIPMLVAAGPDVLAIEDGTPLVVDANDGILLESPPEELLAAYTRRVTERLQAEVVERRAAAAPAVTQDGVQVAVLANVASIDDAQAAVDGHADGVGLVRTEFLFPAREEPPSVQEQIVAYHAITDILDGRPVTFRTFDGGADKPLPFLPTGPEANPFLGLRGIRLSLRRPELLRDQLQAICEVAADAPVRVMFPMVTTVDELRAALRLLEEAGDARRPRSLEIGIMVEVPAVALRAPEFVPHVDFFSVGTNDLTQYALAVDRGNSAVAALANPLDPGVLRLIDELCRQSAGAPVSICGEIAADPNATSTLLALGVRSLSVAPPTIAAIKKAVRGVNLTTGSSLGPTADHQRRSGPA
jgi:multiphosphoryl transfer protein